MYNETVNIEYTDINECVKQNPELNKFQIMKVLKGKIKTHKGYFFKLKDEDIVQLNRNIKGYEQNNR